jgi:hypothetical protein
MRIAVAQQLTRATTSRAGGAALLRPTCFFDRRQNCQRVDAPHGLGSRRRQSGRDFEIPSRRRLEWSTLSSILMDGDCHSQMSREK